MEKVYILKIGGSVATQKNRKKLFLRRDVLEKIAKNICKWKRGNPDIKLIIIHGAGGAGHYLAKKYKLTEGVDSDKNKIKGAILSRLANQQLDLRIFDIFSKAGLDIIPVHSGSAIIQKNKQIEYFDMKFVRQALENNYIPMLYGEMVFDYNLNMSICSGDSIAAFLADKLKAEKVFFATDVDGVFDKDPHIHKNAKLVKEIKLKEVFSPNISLGKSHSQDVTDGLRGKLRSFKDFSTVPSLEEIIVFNGNKHGKYADIMSGNEDKLTRIVLY